MHSTDLRRDHIHGLMMGVAIGDALGGSRQEMSRRLGLKIYGRKPLRYTTLSGAGLPGPNTGLMLMAAQAIVCSGVTSDNFVGSYQQRLSWYPLSFPIGIGPATLVAALKSWLRLFKLPSGVNSTGNDPATRAIFVALALDRAGPRFKKWVELSTRITHSHPLAVDGCVVLASLAEQIIDQHDAFDAHDACCKLASFSSQPELKERLAQLPALLEQNYSCMRVANQFGWHTHISDHIVPTAVMASYCFLRHSRNFRTAVQSAIRLGGDTSSMGAIVGGLSGALLGIGEIPAVWVDKISDFAYGPTWMTRMARRLSHWPHGVDDLYAPPAEAVAPFEQTTLNLLRVPLILANRLRRLPCQLITRTQPRRLRR